MTLSPALPGARRRSAIVATVALVASLLSLSAPLAASADVVGDGPGTVSGTVTLDDGTPVEGAYVNVSSSIGEGTMWGFSTTTDAAGAYEFSGLPAATVYATVYIDGYQQPEGQYVTVSESAPTASVNFVVTPFVIGIGIISGLVTADGVPAANASISIRNEATSQSVYTSSDENGAYELSGLSNGLWIVSAHLGFDYQFLNSQYLTLTDSAPAATANFAFESWPTGTAAISGVITDGETGAPIQGVSVSIYGVNVAHQSSASTDEFGTFTVESLPEGTYYLNYWAFGYLHINEEVSALSDETTSADHALVPINATISGHIESATGAPIEGIAVNAVSAGSNIGFGYTDADGNYVIEGLGAVEYTLTVGGPGTPYDRQETTVLPVAHGDVISNFTLIARTTGSLGGWVLNESGDVLVSSACATLYGSKNKKPLAEVATFGLDFGDGTYTFDNLKPGKYTVEFRDCDDDPTTTFDKVFLGGVKNYKDATFVTVVAGEDNYQNDVVLTQRH